MKLSKQNIPFTMVANEVLYRNDISFAVKGLFAYLFSKPDGWEFSADRIAKNESSEDRKTIQHILQKMELAGLLKRKRLPSGKVDYQISYAIKPPENGLSLFGEEPTKKFSTVKSSTLMQSPTPLSAKGAMVNECIGLFEPINPSFKRLFANKTQRSAMERMITEHGEGKMRQVLTLAVWAAPRKYAPTITTPLQLESKLGDLIAFAHKEKSNSRPSTVAI